MYNINGYASFEPKTEEIFFNSEDDTGNIILQPKKTTIRKACSPRKPQNLGFLILGVGTQSDK